ncbi:PEP-CTERM/exosortase A-associated glycosyltransferase [Natronospira proteinivora]|uniref:PEP-CTERM/exosortase A-associated glycosyltransferase n=1 Tax=Natronospira proteinivora TaxID=1807133 RepID=A0ABT1GAF0_9GAMM|nr:glycosyltransferase family 4 protein [Natronospira proteinivora]MCP1727885.1 PEP-CTERM/exosortase A-associated glycosyltransferase [Natronospira proteinivora]
MASKLVSGLRSFKWRVVVPMSYHLGLPHERIAGWLRLAPLKARLGKASKAPAPEAGDGESPNAASNDPEARYPGPPRYSIYTASSVATSCRALRLRYDQARADDYIAALLDAAPEYEPDIRWGGFLAALDENPVDGLAEGEALLAQFPLHRLRKSLYYQYNHAGHIRRTRELAEALRHSEGAFERSCEILDARERMLARGGVALPAQEAAHNARPATRRVLYLLHNALPLDSGGYATRTHGLSRALIEHGWDMECVTRLGYPSDLKHRAHWVVPRVTVDGVPYQRLLDPSRSYRRLDAERYLERNAETVLKLAKKRRPALLHGASNHINGIAAVWAGRKLGLPSVYEVRGLWELTRLSRQPSFEGSELYDMIVQLETQACQEADQVIAITDALKQLLVDRGVPGEKIAVIPNGVDTERFAGPAPDVEADAGGQALRREWGIPPDALVLGYVGSMPQYEGLDDLIEAVARLREQGQDNLYCLLVGDGDQLSRLKWQAHRLGVSEQIKFTGRVPHEQVGDYYAAMDVMVFPRKPQPVTEIVSPMKPFEAMALGKPVLASDVAALAEIVKDGETGRLFEKGNVDSLAEAIATLADDDALRERLAETALRWVRENRDWRRLAEDASKLYQGLTA